MNSSWKISELLQVLVVEHWNSCGDTTEQLLSRGVRELVCIWLGLKQLHLPLTNRNSLLCPGCSKKKLFFCLRIHSPRMNITVNLPLTSPLRACSISKTICVGWCLIRGCMASYRALGLYRPPIVSALCKFKGKHPGCRDLQCDLVPASACPVSAAGQHSTLWQAGSHQSWFGSAKLAK